MNTKKARDLTKNLVGKQIYFKLSKKALAASRIRNLTPGKLYTVTKVYSNNVAYIENDVGNSINTLLGKGVGTYRKDKPWCAWLDEKTTWILKRTPRDNSSNG